MMKVIVPSVAVSKRYQAKSPQIQNQLTKPPAQDTVRFGMSKVCKKLPEASQVKSKDEIMASLPPMPFQAAFNATFNSAIKHNRDEARLSDFIVGLLEPMIAVAQNLEEIQEHEGQLRGNDRELFEVFQEFLPEEAQHKRLKGEEIYRILYGPFERWITKNMLHHDDDEDMAGGVINVQALKQKQHERVTKLKNLALETPMAQLLTGFIQRYPQSSLDRTAGNFYDYLDEVAADPAAPQQVKVAKQFLDTLKEQLRVAVISGKAVQEVESDSAHGFQARLAELYSDKRPQSENVMSPDQFAHTNRLIEQLKRADTHTPDFNVLTNQLHTILYEVPWVASREKFVTLPQIRQALDEDHYGLNEVKEQILNHMSMELHFRKLRAQGRLPEGHKQPTIICLVGPPGVGKTSLGASIARAMGRKFVRKSLGGISDEAEIRGHRSTYIGAKQGRIIEGLIKAGVNNPVFMLDEIDKLGSDFKGDPSAALLEVLDPEQNHSFQDKYLDIETDLSKVFFIATANDESRIPQALKDRMHVIRLDGYMPDEKIAIAQQHLIPRARKDHAIGRDVLDTPKELLDLDDKTLREIIENYAPERGVRQLNNQIVQIAEALVRQRQESKTPTAVTPENLDTFLGPPTYDKVVAKTDAKVGRIYGMFYSDGPVPGGTLPIYVKAATQKVTDPEKAGFKIASITGNMKDVMKESVEVAFGFVDSHKEELAQALGVDVAKFEDKFVKLYVSAKDLAMPKDGPSAGAAMLVNVVSALTNLPVRGDVAVTGAFNLEGEVNKIGGVREKVTGSYQEGIRTFIIPKANERDVKKIPESVRKNIEVITADNIYDVLKVMLVKPEVQAEPETLVDETPPAEPKIAASQPKFSGQPGKRLRLVG